MSNLEFIDALVAKVREIYRTQESIPLHAPCFRGEEKELVLNTLESTFVSSVGKNVEQFESALARYTGAQFVVAVNSGTAALHTALHVAGVTRGDEVVTTPLTFVATCNAISYCSAEPVFVDVDPDTLGLSPQSLGNFLEQHAEVRDDGLCWNRSTKSIIRACVPVHNLGHPARVEQIAEVCAQYNIAIIEDAAESLGSFRCAQHTGRVGLMGVLSFNGNKIITTGGGGALITDDEWLAKRAKHLTTTAKQSHPWFFHHDEVGFNYRMPNLNAALGLAQIAQLEDFVAKKRNLASCYSEWFELWPEVTFFWEPTFARSNFWLNAILLPDRDARDEFLYRTNEFGIMTRPMWTPMNTLPMYQSCQQFNLDNAGAIENTLVNIPSSVVSIK
jgi:aminotransferase in exopolysaccharide biosynthesis